MHYPTNNPDHRHKIDIKTQTYHAELYRLEERLFCEDRVINRKRESVETYAFGPHWSFHVGTPKPGCFSLESGQEYVDMSHYNSIFLPCFSVFKMKVKKGDHCFRSYVSDHDLPPFMPKSPCTLYSDAPKMPESTQEIFDWVANATLRQTLLIDLYAPGVVRKLKQRLDETFNEELKLGELAPDLLSISKIRQRFRKVYGMTPVAYRNKLRIFSSVWLLLKQNFSVTSAGQEVGFHNRAGYIRQFKREIKEVPSVFHLP